MIDKTFVEEKIIAIDREIKTKECYLRFAKQQDVRELLNNEIAKLALQRDLYLSFYEFEEEEEKEESE